MSQQPSSHHYVIAVLSEIYPDLVHAETLFMQKLCLCRTMINDLSMTRSFDFFVTIAVSCTNFQTVWISLWLGPAWPGCAPPLPWRKQAKCWSWSNRS